MKTLKIGVILLAFLLAAMAMVPMVSAAGVQSSNAATINELNAVSLNQSNTQLPQLQYDKTQKKSVVNGEFKVRGSAQSSQIATKVSSSSAAPSDIPFGAIVSHSSDGVTTVFDSSGQQLFVTKDSTAPQVNTPNGNLPATKVFEVPDKSLIVDSNNVINVFYDKQRILTVLTDSKGEQKKSATRQSFYTPQTLSNQWIEYGETAPIATVGQFSAKWNVPKNPPSVYNYTDANTTDGSQSTIWNGLETQDTHFLLQPVLEWYARANPDEPLPSSANWSIATWWVAPNEQNGNGIHSTRRYGNIYSGELVSQGDLIQGNMIHTGAIWDGAISDLTLGISSTLFLNSSQSSELTYHNLQAYTVLEGWDQRSAAQNPSHSYYNSSYLPGSTTFTNIVIKDIDGNSVIPSAMAGYVNTYWNYPKYGLSVTNSSWPTSISLNTGNI